MSVGSRAGFSVAWVMAAIVAAGVGLGTAWMLAQPTPGLSQFDRLGAEIGCQCGTCPLRPIATCGCGFADGMLDELTTLVNEGHSDEEILTTFTGRYNESIRIKPAASGLQLTAWAAPMLLLTVGSVVVAGVLRRWVGRSSGDEPAPATPGTDSTAPESRLRERLERELRELDE